MDRFELFRVFTRVIDCASFTRAAEQTGMSRSSVSVAIQELEARLGARLIHRTTRRVVPTQEGLVLYEKCRRLIEDIEDVEGLFQGARLPEGRLRVDVPARIGRRVVAPRLPDFLARYPGIQVSLGVTDRMIDVVGEGADCALRVGVLADSSLIARHIGELPILHVASPSYLARRGTPQVPADLVNHVAVGYVSSAVGRPEPFEWMANGKTESMTLRNEVLVDGAEAYIACGLAGLGLIQIPACDAREHLRRGELVEVLAAFRCAPMHMNLLFPQRRHMPRRTEVFATWLGGILAEWIQGDTHVDASEGMHRGVHPAAGMAR